MTANHAETGQQARGSSEATPPTRELEVTGVILAAGASQRFGNEPKLAADFLGKSLLAQCCETALASSLSRIVVVLGADADRLEPLCSDLDVQIEHNPDFALGQSTSVVQGIRSARAHNAKANAMGGGILFLAADQPLLEARHIDAVLSAAAAQPPSEHETVAVQAVAAEGRRGTPVFVPTNLLGALEETLLESGGDEGGRKLLRTLPKERLVEVEIDPWALADIDVPEDLNSLEQLRPSEHPESVTKPGPRSASDSHHNLSSDSVATVNPSTPAFLHLDNPIQNYEWGSSTALAGIQGRAASGKPEAELWIGAHPSAPSLVQQTSGDERNHTEALGSFLQREGEHWFGQSRTKFGNHLPFLLKLLAAAHPLSLQVHPTKERAKSLFNAPQDSPYVDDNHKPEVLCALTDFTALQGFRPFAESAELLGQLLKQDHLGPQMTAAVSDFVASRSSVNLRNLFETLVNLELGSAEATAVINAIKHSAALIDSGELKTTLGSLLQHYPEDPLVIAPLLLNVVHLSPGEALYTGAGTLHSYLEGTGVELMSTSDNVLRAGLTSKPVNVDELLAVTSFEPTATMKISSQPREDTAFRVFPTPAEEFELARLDARTSEVSLVEKSFGEIQVLLCTSGEFLVGGKNRLVSGNALLVSAASKDWSLEGKGEVFRATLPRVQ